MISIDVAAENDILRILEIEQEAISPPWTHGALLSELYREDSLFAVARDPAGYSPLYNGEYHAADTAPGSCSHDVSHDNTHIIGFIILRLGAGEAELLQIAVDKTARRRGAAGLLMSAALEYAGQKDVESIFLEVREGNEAAVSLYRKHGFEPVRVRKDYYSDPVEDALVMKREQRTHSI